MAGLISGLWAAVGGDAGVLERVTVTGPEHVLPSVFDVTGLAAASVAVSTLAVAELAAERRGEDVAPVRVETRAAAAAFRSEALLRPAGWELPPVWDAVAGDYRAADGWIRLHTNYAHHRAAALRALEFPAAEPPDRAAVARAVAGHRAADLEERVVAEGGCAAVMRTAAEWSAHPHGRAVRDEPPVAVAPAADGVAVPAPRAGDRPLSGVRILDLTRVIAGPVCTRTLAGWGASVLRIDPPGFAEVPALLPDVTAGKRRAALDLTDAADRATFETLVRMADAVVHGLRPGALARLGYGTAALHALNPAVVVAAIDAYGWTGPWAGRRGFDSLVQMSSGIAAAGAEASASEGGRPVPLPAQALDHGAGYLLAAGVCRALTDLLRTGRPAQVRASLAGVAGLLGRNPVPGGLRHEPAEWSDADLMPVRTAWGAAAAVPPPGRIGGVGAAWTIPAGPLGIDAPAFTP